MRHREGSVTIAGARSVYRPRRRRIPPPNGFTLLETLTALALMAMLMGGALAAAALVTRYESATGGVILRTQQQFGMIEDFTLDVRNSLRPVSGERRSEFSTDAGREQFLLFDTKERAVPVSLQGGRRRLAIYCRSVGYRFSTAVESLDASAPTMGVHIVWGGGEAEDSSRALVLGERGHREVTLTHGSDGGVTRSVCRMPVFGTIASVAETTEYAFARRLAFRYFDGSTWKETWDSRKEGTLPRAVEFRILFRDGSETTIIRSFQTSLFPSETNNGDPSITSRGKP